MVKFNFLGRFKRFKKKGNSSGYSELNDTPSKLSTLLRRFSAWRQRSSRRLAALFPSKNEVQSSTTQRRATARKPASRLSLFNKRSRQLEQTYASVPLLLTDDNSSSDESTEAIILETLSRVTLESPVIRAVSSTDQVSTRPSVPEEEITDVSILCNAYVHFQEIVMSGDKLHFSSSSSVDVVHADEACQCVDLEAASGEMVKNFEMDEGMDKPKESYMKELGSEKPEEKPPPSGFTSDDKQVYSDSAGHDLIIVVTSFFVTIIATAIIMTVVF